MKFPNPGILPNVIYSLLFLVKISLNSNQSGKKSGCFELVFDCTTLVRWLERVS